MMIEAFTPASEPTGDKAGQGAGASEGQWLVLQALPFKSFNCIVFMVLALCAPLLI